jgi:alginate O-acetyltransferase complex protein AlgI
VLFNSINFVLFFFVVTTLYFALPHRYRWMLLLLASCMFYMFFIPVYILILLTAIVIDYFAGIWIEDSPSKTQKRKYLLMSIVSVCAILFVFKYFNFFNQNFAALAEVLHWNYPIQALQIILPIGLSFHTFQSLSYVIEVYRSKQKTERHFGIYSLYVMYFPQLVAGPIERPQNLLHQLREEKRFDWKRCWDGLSLSLWGLFKKVAVADSLAIYVDTIYNNSNYHSGASLLLATYCFAIQIYCDFSGYSDIARGVSRIYGIELMKNFDSPYFARSIGEFWSRWHISLSTWFRDYVYIPMGGNRVSLRRNFFNIFIVFAVSGFWHGANWTFIIWGSLHGVYLIAERCIELLIKRYGLYRESLASSPVVQAFRLLLTFHLVLLSWVFFRAKDLSSAMSILDKILFSRGSLFLDPVLAQCVLFVPIVMGLEYLNRRFHCWRSFERLPFALRTGYAIALLFGIVLFGIDNGTQFIYFQF